MISSQIQSDANANQETSIGKTCLNIANQHDIVKAKLAERKKEEEKIAYMCEEKLAGIQERIPEWKRNAVQAKKQLRRFKVDQNKVTKDNNLLIVMLIKNMYHFNQK
ncbi:unnamed protein product [Paramecium sonneborni]|uniref:Uncharacterized protein n=1 Tax=Paramecium sonneborni TaxID=65129 RepID=A0A8S1RJQ7_9CILI|nr:unnamed protein product [Paramecium sonneborni]